MEAKLIKENNFYKLIQNNTILTKISTNESINIHYSFGKLSLKNCQEIELGYDLDELADELHKNYPDWAPPVEHYDYTRGVIDGAKTLLEIIGDKKYSEKDMIKFGAYSRSDFDGLMRTKDLFNEYQSLQQTEWDCIVEMDTDCTGEFKYLLLDRSKPKLDADGCLILKRKI